MKNIKFEATLESEQCFKFGVEVLYDMIYNFKICCEKEAEKDAS